MKITVSSGNHRIHLVLPTRLVFSKLLVRLGLRIAGKYAPDEMKHIPPEAVEVLCEEIRRIKKRHKRWEIVDIGSASGDIVRIEL